jgi:uncharacterized membrane protein YcaP (DUF421 family)
MNTVLRSIVIYFILLVIFRLSGKRSLSQVTTFDFVLLLIIGGATSQALLGNDFSITTAVLVIVSLIMIDIGMSFVKRRVKIVENWVDGTPLILVEDGKLLKDRMSKARVAEQDVLEKARELQGLERIDQIKYAVLETSGGITIVPKQKSGG